MRPRRAGDSGCAVVAGTCRQLPAFVVLCDHAFAHGCVRSCWQASRDRRRREGHPFSPLKLIGCLERRLKPTLQILQWECGSAALQPFPGVQSAKALYKSNRVAATTRDVCGRAVPAASPSPASPLPPPPPPPTPPLPHLCHRQRRASPRRRPSLLVAPPILPTAEAAAPSTPLRPAPTRAAQAVATIPHHLSCCVWQFFITMLCCFESRCGVC